MASYSGSGTQNDPFRYWNGNAQEWNSQFYGVRTQPIYFYQGASINISAYLGDEYSYEIRTISGATSGLWIERYESLRGNANQLGDVYVNYWEIPQEAPEDYWSFTYHLIIVPLPTYTHTIIYNANGGSGSMSNTTVTDTNSGNTNVTVANNGFTKTNYKFIGWKINNTGNLIQPGATYPVSGNGSVTAYAQWELDIAQVDVKVNDVWIKANVYVKVNDEWKPIKKVSVKVSDTWEEVN